MEKLHLTKKMGMVLLAMAVLWSVACKRDPLQPPMPSVLNSYQGSDKMVLKVIETLREPDNKVLLAELEKQGSIIWKYEALITSRFLKGYTLRFATGSDGNYLDAEIDARTRAIKLYSKQQQEQRDAKAEQILNSKLKSNGTLAGTCTFKLSFVISISGEGEGAFWGRIMRDVVLPEMLRNRVSVAGFQDVISSYGLAFTNASGKNTIDLRNVMMDILGIINSISNGSYEASFSVLDITNSCDVEPTEEEVINWTNTVVSSSEAYTTTRLSHNVPNERKQAFKWVVAYNPYFYWKVVSHETGIHKVVGAEWHWKDLQHNNFSVDNKPSVVDVTVTQNGEAIPTIGMYYAGIFVKCNIDARMVSKFLPIGALAKDYEKYSPLFFSNTP